MKKVKIKSLKFKKETVSTLDVASIKGGVSGMCTSSNNNLQCHFLCNTYDADGC